MSTNRRKNSGKKQPKKKKSVVAISHSRNSFFSRATAQLLAKSLGRGQGKASSTVMWELFHCCEVCLYIFLYISNIYI